MMLPRNHGNHWLLWEVTSIRNLKFLA